MAKESRKKVVTKKHLARQERERLQARYIMIASLAVILLAVGLVVYGILDQRVLKPFKPVANVNGEKISLGEFQTRVRYIRLNTVQRAEQTYQILQMFGDDPQFQQFYLSNLQQTAQQLEPLYMGQQVLDAMVDETLIRQEAERRGITASQEEMDELLQGYYGFYANGTPTPSPTFEAKPTSTLNPTQRALITDTPTPTVTPTPTSTITSTLPLTPTLAITPTATLQVGLSPTPVITVTAEITGTPGPTATLAPTPTATVYTLEDFQNDYKQEVENLGNTIQFTEADYRALAEMQIQTEKVRDAILSELTQEQEMVWARHIQVADQETAQQVLDRLNQGEDFGALATELSQDVNTQAVAGDLGWQNHYAMKNRFGEAFTNTAFDELEIGEISQPVESDNGFHLIQVLGREVRTLSPEEFEQLRQQEFQNWIQAQREASQIETYDIWMDNVPTQPDLNPQIRQLLANASQPTQ